MNNAFFMKTMEYVEKHMEYELVVKNSSKKTYFHHITKTVLYTMKIWLGFTKIKR